MWRVSESSGIQVGVRNWLLETMDGTIETKFWSMSKPWPTKIERCWDEWLQVQCRGPEPGVWGSGEEGTEGNQTVNTTVCHSTWLGFILKNEGRWGRNCGIKCAPGRVGGCMYGGKGDRNARSWRPVWISLKQSQRKDWWKTLGIQENSDSREISRRLHCEDLEKNWIWWTCTTNGTRDPLNQCWHLSD